MSFIPSEYQQAVFNWIENGTGHAIINAVAGSGKTTTLVEAAKRFSWGKSVLFVAFNKHIVQSLKERLPQQTACKTIHAIGFACVTNRIGKPVVEPDKYLELSFPYANLIHKELAANYDENVRAYLLQKEKNIRDHRLTPLSGWNQLNIQQKSDDTELEMPIAPPPKEVVAARLRDVAHYVRVSLIDYHDTNKIDETVEHFGVEIEFNNQYLHRYIPKILEAGLIKARENSIIDYDDMLWLPTVWQLYPPQFDWVLVDEVQDLSAAQFSLVMKMCRTNGRLLLVGDPFQAIYGFAGAAHDSFSKIKEHSSAQEFPLSICYRCPSSVVDLAKGVVPTIESSPTADEGLVKEISSDAASKSLVSGDFIVCRFTAPLISLCITLIGQKKAAHVLGRDIGKQLTDIIDEVSKIKGFTYPNFQDFLDKLFESKIRKLLSQKNAQDRITSLEDRFDSIKICYQSFEAQSIWQLKSEINELFRDEGGSITLSTIHKAKGLEYDRVFILKYNELPYVHPKQLPWQTQQEFNLKYVAITRAKKELYLLTIKPPEEPKPEATTQKG